jgi:Asp/Glu/hydantoin racemase
MKNHPRIALIHATPVAIDPICNTFKRLWPQARVTNLLDDSLSADLAAAGSLDQSMIDRFCVLAKYVEAGGADAILFTCSAFGAAIEVARGAVKIPVLKPNESMMEEAIATGPRIALLATFEPSLPSMKAELEQLASARKANIKITTKAVPAALTALQAGDDAGHDSQIAAAAAELGDCDALLLCQFSMASAAERIPSRRGRSVFTSPYSAVARLKQLLHA